MARPRGGSWQGDVTVAGKRHRQDGFNTEEEANAWEAQVKVASKLGKPIPAATPEVLGKGAGITLGQLAKRTEKGVWRDNEGALKAGSGHAVRNIGFALAYFGANKPAAEVDQKAIAGYAAHIRENTANSDATINRKLAALSRCLSYGVEIGELSSAPRLKGIRKKEGEGRLRYLRESSDPRSDDSEEALILQTFRLWSMTSAAELTIFLIDTGARWRSEALRLRDEMVNWREGLIVFSGKITKNGKTRAVPMTERVAEIMQRRKGRGVFFGDITDTQYYGAWDRMKAHLGLTDDEEFVPHCLRHTCASRLVQAGEDLYRVQRWLGHSSITQTMRYSHLAPKHLITGKNALDSYNKAREAPTLVAVK